MLKTALLFAQNDQKFKKQILEKGIVGKEFTRKHADKTETKLVYLGAIKNKKGATVKVLNSTFLFGIDGNVSSRASTEVCLYNGANQYLGSYLVSDIPSLPEKIVKGKLVFSPSNVCKQTTKIDFTRGIPKQIFVLCNGDKGDLYPFVSKEIK